MELPVLRMSFSDRAALARELDENLSQGRAFLRESSDIPVLSECVLVLVHPDDGSELRLSAQVVMVSTTGAMCGVGLALTKLGDGELTQLGQFAASTRELETLESPLTAAQEDPPTLRMSSAPPSEPTLEAPLEAAETVTASVPLTQAQIDDRYAQAEEDEALEQEHEAYAEDEALLGTTERTSRVSTELQTENRREKLRRLTAAQQLKVARTGELADRVVVERLYGKQVWEALLQNPRLSIPEVARIARKGTVPKPLLEQIMENGAWLKADAVRRALLGNPKLGPDAVLKLLRATPKHELKLIEKGSAYGQAVREGARKLLRQS